MCTRETERYLSFLLRLWQADSAETPAWRASLESVQTHDLLYFTSVAELIAYVIAVTERSQPAVRE